MKIGVRTGPSGRSPASAGLLRVLVSLVVCAWASAAAPCRAGEEQPPQGEETGSRETPYEIEPVVVRAVRIPQARSDPSAFASTVDARAYEGHFRTLADLLSRQPGVQLRQYGGLGQLSTMSIRGSSAEQVLVLLDGIPLNTGEGGSVDLSTIPLEALERFEVIRGGGSAIYGPDAMGGVVNLVTKAPEGPPESSALVSYGSWDTLKGAVTSRGGIKGTDYLLSATYLQGDGDFTYETSEVVVGGQTIQPSQERTRINNDFSSVDVLARVGFSPWRKLRIDLSNEFFNTERGQPGFEDNPLPLARQKNLRDLTYLRFTHPGPLFKGSKTMLTLFQRFNRIHFTNPEPATNPIDTVSRNYAYGGNLGFEAYGTMLACRHLGRAGVDVLRDELRDEVEGGGESFGSRHRTTVSGYLQDEIVLPGDRVSVLAAGRLEHSDDQGTHPTGKLGLVWRCFQQAYVKANVEKVFRRPTFRELYHPDQGWIRGNPNLAPERSVNVDLGMGLSYSNWFFEVAGFYNRVKETILWLPVSAFTIQPVNIGGVDLRGTEVNLEVRPLDELGLNVNYIYLDAEMDQTGEQMPGRPHHTVNARASFEGRYGALYAEAQYMSEIPVTPDGAVLLGWRTVVDLGGRLEVLALPCLDRRLKWLGSLTLGLDVKNVGNVYLKDIRGVPLPGRTFMGTVRATF